MIPAKDETFIFSRSPPPHPPDVSLRRCRKIILKEKANGKKESNLSQ